MAQNVENRIGPANRDAPSDSNLYQRIGARIAKARETQRLKQEELGQRIGETAITISRWENALRRPSIEDLQKLSEALGTDILYFTQEAPPEESSFKRLSRAISKLEDDDRDELLAMVNVKLQRKSRDLTGRRANTALGEETITQ